MKVALIVIADDKTRIVPQDTVILELPALPTTETVIRDHDNRDAYEVSNYKSVLIPKSEKNKQGIDAVILVRRVETNIGLFMIADAVVNDSSK